MDPSASSAHVSTRVAQFADQQPQSQRVVQLASLLLLLTAILTALLLGQPAKAQNPPPVVVEKIASHKDADVGETISFTLKVTNNSYDGLMMLEDVLPEGVEPLPDRANAEALDPKTNTYRWPVQLGRGNSAEFVFAVIVKSCRNVFNKAVLHAAPVSAAATEPIAQSQVVEVLIRCPDLGDAPDSTNHAAQPMRAYPAVQANYPTVFDPATGLPEGPRHRLPRADAWLGGKVSGERDADLLPDEDFVRNIDPPADLPDHDNYDDSILKWPLVKHCVPTDMTVQVTVVGPQRERFINAWIDWNQDGDWRDRFSECPGVTVTEWVVQDFLTNLGPGVHTITLPAFIPVEFANTQIGEHWMRITLSESKVPQDANIAGADGRGPPTQYRFGETEDYLARFERPGEPKLEIDKKADVTSAAAGDIIKYTIVVFNTGNAPAVGVTVVDPIPAGTTYVPGTLNATLPTKDDSNPAQMKWMGNIPAGGQVIITFEVRVNRDIPCDFVIRNHAAIVDSAGQELMGADAFVPVRCPGQPVLNMRKEASTNSATIGSEIVYTITIANGGNAPANGVTMIDPIPAGTVYVPGSLSATLPTKDDSNPAQMKWTGNIPAGGNVVITFKVRITDQVHCDSVIENKASLLKSATEILMTAQAVVKIECPRPEIKIEKRVDKMNANPGDMLEYTIFVQNIGSGPANGVMIIDPIPAGTTYVAGSVTTLPAAPAASYNGGANRIEWMGNLAPGASVQITFKVQVKQEVQCPFVVHNRAGVLLGANTGTVAAPNTSLVAEARTLIPCPDQPILEIKKQANVTHTGPGGVIEYTIVVSNSGSVPAVAVTMLDPIPGGTSFVIGSESATTPTVVYDAGNNWIKWGGDIPAGGSVTIKFRVKVDEKAGCEGAIFNRAAIVKPTGEPLQIAEAVVKLACEEPKLEVFKRADVTTVTPGGQIEYTIMIYNVGFAPAIGVNMIDFIPAGTNYVFGSAVATLPTVGYDAGIVAVKWTGDIPARSNVVIRFKVTVDPDVTCQESILNRASVSMHGIQLSSNTVFVKVDCQPGDPALEMKKWLLDAAGQQVTTGEIQPGGSAVYYLSIASTNGLSYTVHISDDIPVGLVAVAVSSSDGIAQILAGGAVVVWDGVVGPTPVIIKIQVRATDKLECDSRAINIAHWFARGSRGQSNPVTLGYLCPRHDLGDAPDSTNHPGQKMSAYPAVQANYPTVFAIDPATGRGPKHLTPRPFHLGQGVSGEIEADQGFDQDILNNITPVADKADQDRADDGVLLSSISFNHCQRAEIKVLVSIDPIALAQLNGKGYLNMWVDSNRDGDWADRFECPTSTGAANQPALEHIVIDFPINAMILGAGFHTIVVPTTVPVAWPTDQQNKPAWLRATLSERPSEKTGAIGTLSFGDGRGPNDPFRLGETEDYLLPGVFAQASSDTSVVKRGEIWPDFDPATQTRRWVVGWIINYHNAGPSTASNVHVIDNINAPQTLLAEHSIPLVPHTGPNPLDYNVGNLPAGGNGIVIIRTDIPWTMTPGTVIENRVSVNSGNDSNPLNNSSTATVTVPILPPLIASPLAGTTCTNTVTVNGVAQPGVQIDLYVDGSMVSTLPTDASGNWSTVLTLPAGAHDLHAIARMGAATSDPSPTVTIIVDPSLFWDPISLRFRSDDGHLIIPSGRLDESGWSVFLRPSHTYTISLRVCCDDPNAQVTMAISGTAPSGTVLISTTLTDPDGDHIYVGTFSMPVGVRITGGVKICVTCHLIRRCSDGTVLIDPEGTVFDLTTGTPIASATVSCLQEDASGAGNSGGNGIFSLWNAASTDQINPQTVLTDGYFSFFTPAGTFRLDVAKQGYQPYTSIDLIVIDTPVHHDVPLTPKIDAAAGQQIAVTDSGFEPSVVTVAKGTVIEWINAGGDVHSSTSITPAVGSPSMVAAEAAASGSGWDSGLLDPGESYKRQLSAVGTYTYQDATNPNATATIIVVDATPQPATDKKVFLPITHK